MNRLNDLFECSKCKKVLPKINKLLHEAQCVRQVENRNPNRLTSDDFVHRSHSNPNSHIDVNQNTNIFANNNLNNRNITSQGSNNNNINNEVEDLFYCNKCDNYLDKKEKEDHLLSHMYNDEENSNGNEMNVDEEYTNNGRIRDRALANNISHINNANRMNRMANQNAGSQRQEYIDLTTGLITTNETIRHPNGGITTITRTRSTNPHQNVYNSNLNNNVISSNSNPNDFFQLLFGGGQRNINHTLRNLERQEAIINMIMQHMQSSRDNPVETHILDLLPEIDITDLKKIPEDKKECVVCLCAFELNQKALILPCTHLFHTECIKDWFKTQNTCPICKFKLDRETLEQAMNHNAEQ